jgi:hypothetical protein
LWQESCLTPPPSPFKARLNQTTNKDNKPSKQPAASPNRGTTQQSSTTNSQAANAIEGSIAVEVIRKITETIQPLTLSNNASAGSSIPVSSAAQRPVVANSVLLDTPQIMQPIASQTKAATVGDMSYADHKEKTVPKQLSGHQIKAIEYYKEKLQQLRLAVEQQISEGHIPFREVQKYISVTLTGMMQEFCASVEVTLGNPPCPYAVLVGGSLGRKEASMIIVVVSLLTCFQVCTVILSMELSLKKKKTISCLIFMSSANELQITFIKWVWKLMKTLLLPTWHQYHQDHSTK